MNLLRRWTVAPVAACALASLASAVSPQDLSALFAPPTAAEITAVRADWNSRPLVVEDFRVEATGVDTNGITYHVVSHVVDGQRHYGGIRFPENYVPGQPHAALVVCHGGLVGVALEMSTNFLSALPGQCVADDYFLIIPSYRGEEMTTQFAGNFLSGGSPSYADRDVDDTRALLSAVLANYQDIDHARIGAWGISRGASVALILGARDARIRRVIDIFGFTDLALPSVRDKVDAITNQGVLPQGIGRVVWESSVNPWLQGQISLAEARLAWLRRSVCYFAPDLPPVQAHHGLADTQVDASHTQVLLGALASAGFGPPDVDGFYYPNGQHGLNSLPGHGDRVEPFLCELQNGPQGFCGPTTEHHAGGYAASDYRGTPSLANNDFVFRVNNCPPNSAGLVFVSPTQDYRPSGAGYICLGQGLSRLGVAAIDSSGMFELRIDMQAANPAVLPYFAVGSKVNLQLVFRDIGNPAGSYNWSNGLEFEVRP